MAATMGRNVHNASLSRPVLPVTRPFRSHVHRKLNANDRLLFTCLHPMRRSCLVRYCRGCAGVWPCHHLFLNHIRLTVASPSPPTPHSPNNPPPLSACSPNISGHECEWCCVQVVYKTVTATATATTTRRVTCRWSLLSCHPHSPPD